MAGIRQTRLVDEFGKDQTDAATDWIRRRQCEDAMGACEQPFYTRRDCYPCTAEGSSSLSLEKCFCLTLTGVGALHGSIAPWSAGDRVTIRSAETAVRDFASLSGPTGFWSCASPHWDVALWPNTVGIPDKLMHLLSILQRPRKVLVLGGRRVRKFHVFI